MATLLKPKQLAKLMNKRPRKKIIKEMDALFSKQIRTRDGWTCQRCGKYHKPPTNALHCSHYWGRTRLQTRWEADNCIALCYGCHKRWEGDKQGEYKHYMINRLGGQEAFNKLEYKAECTTRYSTDDLEMLLTIMKGDL